MAVTVGTAVERLEAVARTIPANRAESDGTLEWDSTTIVVVLAHADGRIGLGYTYTDEAAAGLVDGKLAEVIEGADAFAVGAAHEAMGRALRNVGRPGLAWCALSAVDLALWDLKARLIELPLRLCSTGSARRCRSTGAAASPRSARPRSANSWALGSKRESRA
jgi:L-alanine-DL-glutamate epimerase-like enolase superfamily enzyme